MRLQLPVATNVIFRLLNLLQCRINSSMIACNYYYFFFVYKRLYIRVKTIIKAVIKMLNVTKESVTVQETLLAMDSIVEVILSNDIL